MNHTTYNLALDDTTKSGVQETRRFRLTEPEKDRLWSSKNVHAVLVTLSIIGAVASCADGDWAGIFTLPFAAFWAGGLVDVRASTRQVMRVTLSTLAGCIACAIIFSLAAM